ncbi:MAG TPA: histidinol dehydrogenase [Tissierellaceae bacterium]|nr:histidinol dehydrogenase [Tissierellaceae bacterium]
MEIVDLRKNDSAEFFEELKSRGSVDYSEYEKVVEGILKDMKEKGDEALLFYTEKFDRIEMKPDDLVVKEEEFEAAYNKVKPEFIQALRFAIENIRSFHEKQKVNSWFSSDEGIILGQKVMPLKSVGIYVPGGTAAYPSSVLMNAIPAIVAGVERIVMVTPKGRIGQIPAGVLVAANELGIKEIYGVGGAQAIGALAYGTDTIFKVDKIVGPGNIYVALAKKAVYGEVDIDMIAGPSEILIIADDSANERFIAADLLSQAEHDQLASSILITTSSNLAEKVKLELERQLAFLDRKDIIKKSIKNHGRIFLVENIKAAVELSNELAPEHLELCVEEPFALLDSIENAGAIFLGHYSPEPLGDYFAGPNHVLPTSGTSRFYSPLSVDDFIKKSSVIYYTRDALDKVKEHVMVLGEEEGLTAHINSIKVRYD